MNEILLEYNKVQAEETLRKILYLNGIEEDEITIEDVEELDPTGKPTEYVNYILTLIKKNYIPPHNFKDSKPFLKELMELYHEAKLKKILDPEWKDINKTTRTSKTFEEFTKYLMIEVKPALEEARERKEKNVNKGNYKIIHEDNEFKYIEHFDTQSACYFGRGTLWCTSMTKTPNLFPEFKKRNYRVITMLPKNPIEKREKYQFDLYKIDPEIFTDFIFKFDTTDEYLFSNRTIQIYDYLNKNHSLLKPPENERIRTVFNSLIDFIYKEYIDIEDYLLATNTVIDDALNYIVKTIKESNKMFPDFIQTIYNNYPIESSCSISSSMLFEKYKIDSFRKKMDFEDISKSMLITPVLCSFLNNFESDKDEISNFIEIKMNDKGKYVLKGEFKWIFGHLYFNSTPQVLNNFINLNIKNILKKDITFIY